MHRGEKSDLAIVAAKPANKSGQPDAERVEPRARAEGNAGQQRTRRAQDRASVSQALDRRSLPPGCLDPVGKLQRRVKKKRFTVFSTISMPRCCGRRSMPSGGMPHPERTG
jgi:hypothetical protein